MSCSQRKLHEIATSNDALQQMDSEYNITSVYCNLAELAISHRYSM